MWRRAPTKVASCRVSTRSVLRDPRGETLLLSVPQRSTSEVAHRALRRHQRRSACYYIPRSAQACGGSKVRVSQRLLGEPSSLSLLEDRKSTRLNSSHANI